LVDDFGKYKFRQGLTDIMDLARFGNKYLTDKEPWKTIKTDEEATKVVLLDCLQLIAHLAACMQPYLPFTAKNIFAMLNLKEEYKWNEEINFLPNHKINQACLLFSKIEDADIEKQIQKLQKPVEEKPEETHIPVGSEIQYDDFAKLDLRTATIIEAEKVEKADKLLKIKLNLGFEERTVVSGIAQHFKPEEIVGKKVLYLANLAPRKLRGIESSGMILLAEDAQGNLIFVSPEKDLPNGSIVK
jgi:methionyl-tRNA synthetase